MRSLEREGFVAVAVSRASEALDMTSCLRFAVLVCTQSELEEETVEAMRQLHTQQGTRGIAVTDSPLSAQQLRKAQEAGFARHLLAPAPFAALVSAIRELKA